MIELNCSRLVEELNFQFDFDKIKSEVNFLLDKHNYPKQICLQGKNNNFTDWQLGTGVPSENEKFYKFIHQSILNFEISRIISYFNGVRTRIMTMNSRTCYSVHRDFSKRIHIPIKTDSQAFMVWPYENYCKHLELGKIYMTDTTKMHSFLNGSVENRIHLVMCVY